ncbi:MAG: hypothetical protein IIA03_03190, partial [Proteobacteria bacterium]|nr:hypothetical protein [Pseudomonadota bacterium]
MSLDDDYYRVNCPVNYTITATISFTNANGDLAHAGKCLVSQVDQGRDVTGLPETVAVVNGLRYHFAGAYQRGLFAANMAHYGVRRELLHAKGDRPVHSLTPKVTN